MQKINKYKLVTANFLNVSLITSVVLLTKWLLTHVQLPCSTLLVLQCLTAFLGLIIYEQCNFFAVKTVHLDVILVLSVIFSLLVLFANYSLKFNSVILYHSVKSVRCKNTILTRVLVVFGSFLNVIYDKNSNHKDLLYGAVFLILTVIYQLILKKKQTEMRMDLNQLMFYQLPLCSIFLFPLMIYQSDFLLWSLLDLFLIVFTCTITFLSVLLTDYCSKHITNKHVLNHLQCALTVILGIYIFESDISLGQWFGIFLIIFGNFLYDYYQWSGIFKWNRKQVNKTRNL